MTDVHSVLSALDVQFNYLNILIHILVYVIFTKLTIQYMYTRND